MDFFSLKVLTPKGMREVYLLVFLHIQTRRVMITPSTEHPNEAWVISQMESFVNQARSEGLRISYVQRDRDTKYASTDETLKRHHIKTLLGTQGYPNSRAYVESFIGRIKAECLNLFVFFGKRSISTA